MMNTNISLEDKWTTCRGRIMLNGTQAIARVLLTQAWLDSRAGLDTAGFVSGYRGSPLGNLDTTLWSISDRLEAARIRFQPGVNEDLAATAIAGTQQIDQIPGAKHQGVFAAWYGKGPGVDRSGDAFKHGNYAGAHRLGGVVLFYGDDHTGKSSTVAHQSEQALAANLIPSFYPTDVGELLHHGLLAFALSRYCGLWTAVKCVNEVAEQTASVNVDLEAFSPILPAILGLPPEGLHASVRPFDPLRAEQIAYEHRLPLVASFVRSNGLDRTYFRAQRTRLAIVSAGKSYGDVRQALTLLGLDDASASALGISLYKVGCIWPLDGDSIVDFARGHEVLLVVEEKKSFVEAQIASAMANDRAAPRLIGKTDESGAALFSSVLPLNPADIALVISGILKRMGLDEAIVNSAAQLARYTGEPAHTSTVKRSPFFCSGCPHNTSTRIPDGSLSMTGIGCHTMVNFVSPDKAMLPTQMGGEGSNWTGIAPFSETQHIFQNMGDGTYYHSGLLAIRSAVASGANITFKILYNDAVAMTGGQPVDGPLSVSAIAWQVRSEGVKTIVVLSDNPDFHRRDRSFPSDIIIRNRDDLDEVQRELRTVKGCSILIYEQTCAAEKRRRRKRGALPDPMKRIFIAEDVCEGCGDCSTQSTCVSILPKETPLGLKRAIDQSSCNKDYSCNKGFCPSFITVYGAETRKPARIEINADLFASLPEPKVAQGRTNIMVAGIGGTGVITVGALLGMAAHIDGRGASVFDMTGLAQKNGAVFSHIRIADAPGEIQTQRLGRGEADLLLAFDLIASLSPEAAATLHPEQTYSIANETVMPTTAFQFDRNTVPEPETLLARLGESVSRDRLASMDASTIAFELLGDTVGANLMLVGMACQKGLLPVSAMSIERAITLNGVAVKLNLAAFRYGRLFAVAPERVRALIPSAVEESVIPTTLEEVVEYHCAYLAAYQDEALSNRFRQQVRAVHMKERAMVPNSDALTLVFARNYAKLLAIKDEYEVARLLTDARLHAMINRAFGPGARIAFNLAPPFLSNLLLYKSQKLEFPSWIVLPILRFLRSMKRVRGTMLDPFGWTAERRAERGLVGSYQALMERTLDKLNSDNLPAALGLMDEIASVRGYGHVREAAMKAYTRRIEIEERLFLNVRSVQYVGK